MISQAPQHIAATILACYVMGYGVGISARLLGLVSR